MAKGTVAMSVLKKHRNAYLILALGLFVTWAPDLSFAQVRELSNILTVGEDNGTGIISRVKLVRYGQEPSDLGLTTRDGVLRLSPQQSVSCSYEMILVAKPCSERYKETSKPVKCTDPEIVKLDLFNFAHESSEVKNLLANIVHAVTNNDPALVALLYSELASRLAPSDQKLPNDYAELAVYAWADATNFSGEPVGPGGGNTLTSVFVAHVEEYQRSNGIERTGLLDYRTFANKAEHNIAWFLYNVGPEPDAVLTQSELAQRTRPTLSDVNTPEELPLVTALINVAEDMASAGVYGDAALIFNEARARVADNTQVAAYIEHRVYENAGRALSVPLPVQFDPLQQRFVMTSALVEAIRARQHQQPTGILDYQTLRSLAEIDVAPFLARYSN